MRSAPIQQIATISKEASSPSSTEPKSHDVLRFVCLQKDSKQCSAVIKLDSTYSSVTSESSIVLTVLFDEWKSEYNQDL